jgi:hypothetical protein
MKKKLRSKSKIDLNSTCTLCMMDPPLSKPVYVTDIVLLKGIVLRLKAGRKETSQLKSKHKVRLPHRKSQVREQGEHSREGTTISWEEECDKS